MSSNDNSSPPGSSTYDSNTMYVGDGTWDTERNTFLLPNLQGLNFATMQYNGMGNRFRDLPQYHVLITGHGVLAAITFLGVLPVAIFFARFYHAEGRVAYKMHVYLQIITVFLVTVVFTLGFIAVGPERALSNPHHGIGVAIYVCILVQFLYGWWWSRRERKRTRPHPTIPLKVHIHRLFGRAIAILGIVQIALGLTLYGSPKVLFILYALWVAFLLFWYLTLEYRSKPHIGAGGRPSRSEYSDYTGSYLTGDRTELTGDGRERYSNRKSSHWGRKVLAGAGALGAYEWYKDRRERKLDEKDERYEDRERSRRHSQPPSTPGPPGSSVGPHPQPPVMHTPGYPESGYGPSSVPPGMPPPPPSGRQGVRPLHSPDSWDDEDESEDGKYRNRRQRQSGGNWRDRLLGAGAGIAAFEGVKSMFGGRRKRSQGYVDSQVSYDRPSQTDVSRVEAGQAPFSPDDARNNNTGRRAHFPETPTMTPTRPPRRRRPSVESMSYEDDASYATPAPGHNSAGKSLGQSMAAMGAVAGFREWIKRRKERSEQEKADRQRQHELDQQEQEFNRRNSTVYPRPQDANRRRQSNSGTLLTGPTGPDPVLGSNTELSRHNFRPDTLQPPLPAAAGAIPSVGMPPSSMGFGGEQQMNQNPVNLNVTQSQEQHQMPYHLPPPPPGPPPNMASNNGPQAPLQMPAGFVEPDPSRLMHEQTQRQSTEQQQHNAAIGGAAGAAAVGAGLAASQRTQSMSPSRRGDSRTRLQPSGRGSSVAASSSQVNNGGVGSTGSPPVSVKVNMHPDGRHVTLRRLNEEEAAAERQARKRERRTRRGSSFSSGGEENGRYRRDGAVRPSSQQPITNIPPIPAMSSSAGASHRRPSELNLPPALPPAPPAHSSPLSQASPPAEGIPSGLLPAVGPAASGQFGSPGAVPSVGTDLSSRVADNRKRRRAERARRLEAARGGNRVEFS